jgi:integrase/recombinase XerC
MTVSVSAVPSACNVAIAPPPLSLLPALPPSLSQAAAKALDTTPQQIIARWLAGLSASAVRSYTRAMRSFCDWAMTGSDASPERALQLLCDAGCGPAHSMVMEWRDHLLQTGLSSGSVACQVVGISSLLKACRRAGLIGWRLEQVQPKIERRCDRSGPRRGDVERLVEHLDALAELGKGRAVRDAAIVRLLYVCAMRRGEVCGLQIEHVQLEHADGPVILAKRKGGKEQQAVLVSGKCADALRRWIEIRGTEAGPLFARLDRARGGLAEQAITGEGIRRMLIARAGEAGIKGRIRPHGLRHSAATQVASCASLGTLMAVGGWKSLSAAQNYIDKQQVERKRGLSILEL